ncbi:MAG: helix-turn-helix domain-containing protein, partial [Eubacterium sp.]|nr:helix-turn-helix domain-containing protein [Eubacterium sp.]
DAMLEDISLREFLENMLEKYGTKKNDIIKRSNLDQTYAYQIFQGTKKNPSREKLLRLALAFPLTVDETKKLLYYGGVETLYPRIARDAYIMYAIHNGFSVIETDEYLDARGEETLG